MTIKSAMQKTDWVAVGRQLNEAILEAKADCDKARTQRLQQLYDRTVTVHGLVNDLARELGQAVDGDPA